MPSRISALCGILLLLYGSTSAVPENPPSCYQELFQAREARGPARLATDAPDDETGYDVLHYNLEIRFDPLYESVQGSVEIQLAGTQANLTQIPLNLRNNMVVDSVTVNGSAATFTLTWVDDFTVNLPQAIGVGDTVRMRIDYHGFPIGGVMGALSWGTTGGGATLISSLSEPEGARTWWPCKDMPCDKATARMVWTVPAELFATGNGLLQSVTTPEPGWKSYEWVENYPITTYLIAVTATNFAHFRDWYVTMVGDSVPLDHYVYPEDSLNATIEFADLPQVMDYFASVFGEYPFWEEKYGHAEFPFGGAMEHQTLTSYGAGLINGTGTYHYIMVHELAHQWWGDLVTCETWMDLWLNEGFATYCDALWYDYDQGLQAFQNRMEEFRQVYFWSESVPSQGRFPIYDPQYLWGGTVYQKGAWILHMIRYVIGEDNFWNFWYYYRDEFGFDAVTDQEYQQALEDFTGMDLDWFFDEWVYMAGYPEYQWGWTAQPQGEDSSLVFISIRQVQQLVNQTPIFTMPIQMQIVKNTGEELVTIWNTQSAQNFHFTVSGNVQEIVFDPQIWILKTATEVPYVSVSEEKTPLPLTQALLTIAPNPANPTARIRFASPSPQRATLTIYNPAGQVIARLFDGAASESGVNVTWDGSKFGSGIYLVRLDTETDHLTQKLTILK
jgi:aminopeptidase N